MSQSLLSFSCVCVHVHVHARDVADIIKVTTRRRCFQKVESLL